MCTPLRPFEYALTGTALGLLLTIAASPAAAQQSTLASGIEGRVTDETGGALPGASVTIRSQALQVPQLETVSDENGRYRFARLPGGLYSVTFRLAGFKTITRERLALDANFVATIDARLGIGQLEETVTVTGDSPVVDVRSTTVVSNIKDETIALLPTSRGYEDIGKLAPGIRVEGVPDVGGNKTGSGRGSLVNYGSNNGGSTLMLDGVNTDGTAGYFDMGAVEEMIVRPAGNDPEIATPGMAFQAIVKSGGNAFKGEGLYAWQGRSLQSENVDDALRAAGVSGGNPMDGYYDANVGVGGRVVRDRLWFFTSVRRREYRQEVVGFSGGPGADGRYFTADDEGGLQNDRESNLTGKLTAQPARSHRLSWMHHYDYKKTDNRGANAFRPHEAAGDYELPNHIYRVEWLYTVSDRSVVNASVGRSYWNSRAVPYSDNPPAFDNVTQRWSGAYVNSVGSDSTPAGSLSGRWQYDASYSYFLPNWLGGTHELKAGGFFTQDVYNKFQELRGAGTGGAGNDFLLYFSNGAPFEVLLYNSPFVSKNTVNYQSGFVRDNWRIGERLTLSVGLRVERYAAYLPAQSKPAGPFSQAADYARTDLYDWRSLAPRVGLSYPLTADNRTVVKATYGRFNFALRASDSRTIRNFNKNDYSASRYRWTDVNGNRTLDYPGELGTFVATEGGSSTVFNPNIEQPQVDEATLHLEREVAGGFSARVGYVYKRESNLFQLLNTARPYDVYNVPISAVDPGPDGTPRTADDGPALTYFDFSPAYAGRAFERFTYVNTPGYTDRFHNVEVGVDKRLSNRWQMRGSYLATRKNMWIAGVPQTPNEAFFPKNQTWETTVRLSGSFEAPFGIQTAAVYEYQSGVPLARDVLFRGLPQLSTLTLRMEPLGSQRLPAVRLLNVRAAKRLPVSTNHAMTLQVDLYNALNTNEETARSVRSGPTYGRITAIIPPRVARLGVTYSF
jgi:hypothetical protein